jgi:hypothetical protein
MGYHDFCRVSGTHTGREGDVSDVERITDLKVADIDLDGLWQVVRKAGDLDGVNVLLDQTARLDTGGLTVEVRRDVGRDGGFFVNRAEVHVHDDAGQRVVLDGLEESETSAVTFDLEVDDDVFRAAVGKDIVEGFRIDLEVDVCGALAVDHGGKQTFAAHLVEWPGAGAEARCCFERGLLSHDVEYISSCAAGDYCTQYGMADVASRSGVVKNLFEKPRDDFSNRKQ